MNSDELTQPLNDQPPAAPSTQPLLKEMLADIRELKQAVVHVTELVRLLLQKVENVEARLERIEREQALMRIGLDKMTGVALRHKERIIMLERQFETQSKLAA